MNRHLDIGGKRVLEIGCGRGDLVRVLASQYECECTGVDIVNYPEWVSSKQKDLQFRRLDVTAEPVDSLGKFDAIVSLVVLEHVAHPFTMLKRFKELLAPGGSVYFSANLYRGPKASHRYRQVNFPWPHLLFSDEVFAAFYRQLRGPDAPAVKSSWVNKLTFLHYKYYLDEVGFAEQKLWLSKPNFDEDFYVEFSDILERYPRFDLAHDFVFGVLKNGSDGGS